MKSRRNYKFLVGFVICIVIISVLNSPFHTALAGSKEAIPAGLSAADWSQIKGLLPAQLAYLKASNTGVNDQFGYSIAVDGNTVVVGAYYEDSNATGVNGNQDNNSASDSGAAYVFTRNGTIWSQQAYLKTSNTEAGDGFGYSIAIDGDTVMVGAPYEDSNATGMNGDQNNNLATNSGAVYVFTRSIGTWSQQAYLKASNTGGNDEFGWSLAISGEVVVVGAHYEDSNATGVNGDQNNNSSGGSGAAYVFTRNGTTWSQQAYLKASNTGDSDYFSDSVAVSGETIVVGAYYEDSNATGVNGVQNNNYAAESGAAYVFTRDGTTWSQQAYLKASNTGAGDYFGWSIAVSGDTIVVGAGGEDSNATGMNGDQNNNLATDSGAVYIFTRSLGVWSQQAYLKTSNTGVGDTFGISVSIEGDTVLTGAHGEDSNAIGVDGNQNDNSASNSGAAYIFSRSGTTWSQQAYLKASNTGGNDQFGLYVAISGETVIIGANYEDGNATGVNGDQNDNSATNSGAAYIYYSSPSCTPPSPGVSFVENFDCSTSPYFFSTNNVQMNVAAADANDLKVAQFILPEKVDPDPEHGPELLSTNSTNYLYGTFKARLKTGKCAESDSDAGVVTGFFTFHNYQTDLKPDENDNQIPDNSEIDFEWLCAQPNVVYLSLWTDYQKKTESIPEKRVHVGRTIDLSEGKILETFHEEYDKDTLQQVRTPLNGKAGEDQPPTDLTIQGLPSSYDSNTTFYEYGFYWSSNRVKWWIVNPVSGQKIILWDYQGPAVRITKRPAALMFNLWHTDKWSPGGMTAIKSPDSPVSSYLDWASYDEISTPPDNFSKSAPANNSLSRSLNLTLSWSPSSNATAYEYCLDKETDNNNFCDSSWLPAQISTSVPLSGLNPNATYYWQVRATNGDNITEANSGIWWMFKTTALPRSFYSIGTSDGWILESTETSGVGGTLNATDTTFRLGDEVGDKQYRAILSFNTAGLPDNAVIVKANLQIKKQGIVTLGTNPFTILGRLKADIGRPYFGTGLGLVINDFQAAAGTAAVGIFDTTPVNNWYSAVISRAGYSYINLIGTTQFRLYFTKDDNDDNGADYTKFFSGNYPTASARPTLIIEYYVP
jgi:hypothetical protein